MESNLTASAHWHLAMSTQSSTKRAASNLVCMLGCGSRRPTAHIFRNAKEPHLVVTDMQELNPQAPLGEVALVRLRAGRPLQSVFQLC